MGIAACLLPLMLTFSAPTETGGFAVFFRKGKADPYVGRMIRQDASSVTMRLLPGMSENTFSRADISGIQMEGSERFNRYLKEYRILAQSAWLFAPGDASPKPGYPYDREKTVGVWLVYDTDKGWVEWHPAENPFEKGDPLTGPEISYMLGTVPGYKSMQPDASHTPAYQGQGADDDGAGDGDDPCSVCRGKKHVTCSHCRGGYSQLPCRSCNGRGQKPCKRCNGTGHASCTACQGSGTINMRSLSGAAWSKTCEKCRGSGKMPCISCDGRKALRCRACNGRKTTRQVCETCNGSARIPCPECVEAGAGRDKARSAGFYGNMDPEKQVGTLIVATRLNLLARQQAEERMLEKLAAFRASMGKGLAAFDEAQAMYTHYFRDKSTQPLRNLLKKENPKSYNDIMGLFRKSYSCKETCEKARRWAADKTKNVQGFKQTLLEVKHNPAAGNIPKWYPRSMVAYLERHKGQAGLLENSSKRLVEQITRSMDWATQFRKQRDSEASFHDMIRKSLADVLPRSIRALELDNGVLTIAVRGFDKQDAGHWQDMAFDASGKLFPVYGEFHLIQLSSGGDVKAGFSRQDWQQERSRRESRTAAGKKKAPAPVLSEETREPAGKAMPVLLLGGIIACLMLLVFFWKLTGRKTDALVLKDPDEAPSRRG